MIWRQAMEWVKSLRVGGYTDWRLPTREELEAFANQGGERPAGYFNNSGFRDVQAGHYWSSSIYASSAYDAWGVYMGYGYVGSYEKGSHYYVWPVRDAK
ncbi:MAG: DUF1566 domain-containing protein [Trichlorobacter sp.]